MPATIPKTNPLSAAEDLARRITWGTPQPKLTAEIVVCNCPPPARAGLHLMNGDWDAAHKIAQDIETPLGSHWHALVHRHEPDLPNSKYWLHHVGKSPIYPRLAEAAQVAGQAAAVAPKGEWDAARFADCFAASDAPGWTRDLDALEIRLLLEHSLLT